MAKTKCPSCDAELDIPDDPRVGELLEQLKQANAAIARLSEKLEAKGGKVPPEVKETLVKGKKKVKKYEGIFLEDDEEIEVDDDADDEAKD